MVEGAVMVAVAAMRVVEEGSKAASVPVGA